MIALEILNRIQSLASDESVESDFWHYRDGSFSSPAARAEIVGAMFRQASTCVTFHDDQKGLARFLHGDLSRDFDRLWSFFDGREGYSAYTHLRTTVSSCNRILNDRSVDVKKQVLRFFISYFLHEHFNGNNNEQRLHKRSILPPEGSDLDKEA